MRISLGPRHYSSYIKKMKNELNQETFLYKRTEVWEKKSSACQNNKIFKKTLSWINLKINKRFDHLNKVLSGIQCWISSLTLNIRGLLVFARNDVKDLYRTKQIIIVSALNPTFHIASSLAPTSPRLRTTDLMVRFTNSERTAHRRAISAIVMACWAAQGLQNFFGSSADVWQLGFLKLSASPTFLICV